MILIYLLVSIILILVIFWLTTFVYTSYRGSPYVPIKDTRLHDITQFIKKGDRVADLGCGDGRVLVEAVNQGATIAEGWESDFLVYLIALWRINKSGVDTSKIKVHFADMWYADLSQFNIIYTYQMTKYMGKFKQKLLPQLKPGTLIISPDYQIPGMKVWKKITDTSRGIYIYKI